MGSYVAKSDLQAGDIILFKIGGSVSHVGIYIGSGMMVHAPTPGQTVTVVKISTNYWTSHYYCARRLY